MAANIQSIPGFDAAAYLAANPDVAKAAAGVSTMSPEQYAAYHYQTFGMNEGRANPLAANVAAITQSRTANTGAPVVQPGNSALLPSDQFNWLARAGGMGASPPAFDLTGGNTGYFKNATYNASPLMQRYLTPQMSNQANPGQPLQQPPVSNLGMSAPVSQVSNNPYTQTPGFNQSVYDAYANNPAFHQKMAAYLGNQQQPAPMLGTQQPPAALANTMWASNFSNPQTSTKEYWGYTGPDSYNGQPITMGPLGPTLALNDLTFDPNYWKPNTQDQRLRMHGTPSGPGLTRPGMSARPVNPFLVRN